MESTLSFELLLAYFQTFNFENIYQEEMPPENEHEKHYTVLKHRDYYAYIGLNTYRNGFTSTEFMCNWIPHTTETTTEYDIALLDDYFNDLLESLDYDSSEWSDDLLRFYWGKISYVTFYSHKFYNGQQTKSLITLFEFFCKQGVFIRPCTKTPEFPSLLFHHEYNKYHHLADNTLRINNYMNDFYRPRIRQISSH